MYKFVYVLVSSTHKITGISKIYLNNFVKIYDISFSHSTNLKSLIKADDDDVKEE